MKDNSLFNIIEEMRNWSQSKGSLVRLCSLLKLDYESVCKALFVGGITDDFGQPLPSNEPQFVREAFMLIMLYYKALQKKATK